MTSGNDSLLICPFINWVFSCWSLFTSWYLYIHIGKPWATCTAEAGAAVTWDADRCLITHSLQWKTFIYLLNRCSFNDTWALQFLGNFFVITDKFIILTIKLIKHRATATAFWGKWFFWCHRNPFSLHVTSPSACCLGSPHLVTRGGGKSKSSTS